MGNNSSSIPEKTIEALAYLHLSDVDFGKADKNHDGALSAEELLKLLRFKENTLRRHANSLSAITEDDCEKIVTLADKNKDHAIDIGEFHFALGKVKDNVYIRREAQRLALKMMDDEKKRRITEAKKSPYIQRRMSAEAKQFQKGMMIKASNFGVKGSHRAARKENRRRAAQETEKERSRRVEAHAQRKKPRGRHDAARMIGHRQLMLHNIGLSRSGQKGLSEAQIRAKNQERVAVATKKEQQERANSFSVPMHFRHKTTQALHEAWMENTGLSAAERSKMGSEGEVRAAHQKRAIRAMEAQRKQYLHQNAADTALEKRERRQNQLKANLMMERERVRQILEKKRSREQALHKRKENRKKAAASMDHEQARRVHGHKQAAAHNAMARGQNQRKAAASMDHEQARRVHGHRQAAAHNAMARGQNQKRAAAMRDNEQARLVHAATKADVHSDMKRRLNRKNAQAAISKENARRQAQKSTSRTIKNGPGAHPHAKAVKQYHKRTQS